MKVLVTGASGFLGSWTVRALAAEGHTVTALVRNENPWRLEGVEGVDTVVAVPAQWPGKIERSRPEVVIALDWAGVAGDSRESEIQWSNVRRQLQLLKSAARAGSRRFVGLGSQAEYGPRDDVILESMATAPVTEYGRAKVAVFEQLKSFCEASSLEWGWARVFSAFGPLDNESTVLHRIADASIAGEPIRLSSGEQRWSYLCASDVGRALSTIARSYPTGIVNVGHPNAPRLRDTLEQFDGALDTPTQLVFDPSIVGMSLRPDVSKLGKLGWKPQEAVADGLRTTARWLLGHPARDTLTGGTLPIRPPTERS